MFHTARDSATFFAEMLLILGAGVLAIYAAGVLIGLVFKSFRSSRVLYISIALSVVASIPVLLALLVQWPYLPDERDMNPAVGVLLLVDAALLSFVWAAPVIQYRLVRRSSSSGQSGGFTNN